MKRQGRNDPYHDRLFKPRNASGGSNRGEARAIDQLGQTTHPTTRVPWWLLGSLTIFGLIVLPHLTIAGHHYRLWFL